MQPTIIPLTQMLLFSVKNTPNQTRNAVNPSIPKGPVFLPMGKQSTTSHTLLQVHQKKKKNGLQTHNQQRNAFGRQQHYYIKASTNKGTKVQCQICGKLGWLSVVGTGLTIPINSRMYLKLWQHYPWMIYTIQTGIQIQVQQLI